MAYSTWPPADAFGLDRASRAQGVELGQLYEKVRPASYETCEGPLAVCLERSRPVARLRNQLASNMALLMLPAGLLDPRRWHWQAWLRDPSFGAPAWLAPLTNAVVRHGVTLALLTWSVLALELALAAAIVMPRERAAGLLPLGIALHIGIAAVHGLLSSQISVPSSA